MPGTFSVPERMPRSWPPPSICATSCTRGFLRRTYKRAHALRSVNLVRRDRRQIDVVLNHVERNLADRLHRVGVEQHAALMAQRADFADRLQHANLVVGGHDRDQDRLVIHGALQVVEIDPAILLHRQIGDAEAVLLQPLAGVEHRLVLGGLGDDVIALFAVHLGDALDGKVVALGGAGGEDDLLRRRADQLRNLLARLLHRLLGHPSKLVIAAGRVAEVLGEVGQHRLHHARIDARGGVVVHVDGQLHILGYHCSKLHSCSLPVDIS